MKWLAGGKGDMPDYKLYSADSHVSEPPDLWKNRIDPKFLYRAPYVETRIKDGQPQDFMIYEGFPPHPVSIGLAAKSSQEGDKENFSVKANKYSEALPGGWDPAERLKDQDLDGIEGEVLHPTLGFRMFWLKDAQLKRAVFQSYNDWLAEFVSYNPQRLVGLALIALEDIQEGIKELERAKKKGLKGCMIGVGPADPNLPYSNAIYDPFWAAAQELEMPITLHTITGSQESRWSIAYWNPEMVLFGPLGYQEAERSFAHIILSGVLERFPRLQFTTAENGTDWIPMFLRRIDRAALGGGAASVAVNVFPTKLSMKPSEYWARQIWTGFITERDTIPNRHIIGVDKIMWASDYPHFASTFPNSVNFINTIFEGIPDEDRRKMTHDNVMRLYNIAPVAVPA